jgi:aminopeptidase N
MRAKAGSRGAPFRPSRKQVPYVYCAAKSPLLAAAKTEAWKTLVESKDLSNALVNSASLGFGRVHDLALIEPYVDRYFESALHVWKLHTFKIAEYLMINLYPVYLANEALASKTREWIAKPQIKEIPALRRIMIENLAAVDRALAAQKRDEQN